MSNVPSYEVTIPRKTYVEQQTSRRVAV